MILFKMLHPKATQEMLGFIPHYFDERDHQSAEKQMRDGYTASAGSPPSDYFVKNPKFKMKEDGSLKWPGDPWMKPLAEYKLGEEMLRFYEAEMFSITQPDGAFKVWRLD